MASQDRAPSARLASRRAARALYHVSLIAAALAAAVATLQGIAIAAWNPFMASLNAARRDPTQLGLHETLVLLLTGLAPLVSAVLGYFFAWQVVRLVQLARYLGALRTYARAYVDRHAPLASMGFASTGLPFAADGAPQEGAEQPIAAILPGQRGTLLLGDAGIGKTTALWQCAAQLARRRTLLSVAFGRAPLPIVVPLAGYAAAPWEEGRPRLRYLAAEVRAFGPYRVAARLPATLLRWNAVLLCDGLDEVPEDKRTEVAEELATLTVDGASRVRLVVTCALGTYLREPALAAPLKRLQRVVLTGLGAQDLAHVLRQAHRTPRRSGQTLDQLLKATQTRGLGAQVGHPATLAALLRLRAAGMTMPTGRARVTQEYAKLLCLQAGGGADSAAVCQLIGWVSASMRTWDMAFVPVAPGDSAGDALTRWCLEHSPLAPNIGREAPNLDISSDASRRITLNAIAAGILEWLPDGLGIQFAQPALASAFAAHFLAAADDPATPFDSHLLRPEWCEPLLLWAGVAEDPGSLAIRMLDLTERSSAASPRARRETPLKQAESDETATVALAMGMILEAIVPLLADSGRPGGEDRARLDHSEATLRDLLDRVHALLQDRLQRQRFVEAMIAIEHDSGCDLSGDLAHLARAPILGRLVRAQAIGLLGALGTPSAIDALVELLTETDAVLRSAVDSAVLSAGPGALARLQEALSSSDELIRARATDVLSQGGPAAIAAALAGLDGPDPLQRAAAARILGALRADVACDALLARMQDSDQNVRLAAAWALGRVGTLELVPVIVEHLTASDADVRAALALALGALGGYDATATLIGLLDDTDARVRTAAAEALGKLGNRSAIARLRTRLDDKDQWAQAAAATALRRLEAHVR